MPSRPLRFCAYPGCSKRVPSGMCEEHQQTKEQSYESTRLTSMQRGYDSRWKQSRDRFILTHPLCAECERHGKITKAYAVDHIVPHKGDYKLFWDPQNWQPLCHSCHSTKTAKEDGRFGKR